MHFYCVYEPIRETLAIAGSVMAAFLGADLMVRWATAYFSHRERLNLGRWRSRAPGAVVWLQHIVLSDGGGGDSDGRERQIAYSPFRTSSPPLLRF